MGYEAFWLPGSKSDIFEFIPLYRSHAFIYFLNHKIFGWNASGWYFTGLIIHILTTLIVIFSLNEIFKLFIKKYNSKIGSFFIGSVFGVSPFFHDVITWGSFNAYYGVILICVLLSIIFFIKYLLKSKLIYLLFGLFFFSIGLINRETTLISVPIIIILNYFLYHKINIKFLNKKFLYYLLSLIFLFCVYLIFRTKVGGVSGDTIDENVKLRIALINNGEYFELLMRVIATFFRNFITLIFPYELVINWKNGFFPNNQVINGLSYVIFGIIAFMPFLFYAFNILLKKIYLHRSITIVYLVGFSWVIISLGILGLAIPNTDYELARDYVWNNRRYNYFGYIGMIIIYMYFIYEIIPQKNFLKILSGIILFFSIFNFLLVKDIQRDIYKNEHKIVKNFHQDFKNMFPKFDNKLNYVYGHPSSNKLKDYLFEFGLMLSHHYNYLKDSIVFNLDYNDIFFKRANNGKIKYENIKFVYYDEDDGLKNIKPLFDNYFNSIDKYKFKNNQIVFYDQIIPIEIPIVVNGKIKNNSNLENLTQGLKSLNYLIHNGNLEVKNKMIFYDGFEHPYYLKEFLIDGKINDNYYWLSNGLENYVDIILENEVSISGFWILSHNIDRSPTSFNIEYFDENIDKWIVINKIENDLSNEKKIIFNKIIKTKKLRLNIFSTTSGHNSTIDEIGLIFPEEIKYFKNNSLVDLINQNYKNKYNNHFWVNLSWKLNDEEKIRDFYYLVDINKSNFKLYITESEFFKNKKNYFFNSFYEIINIRSDINNTIQLENLTLEKRYNFN